MPAIRDHFGSPCPDCRSDILQAAPSTNRMPGEEKAWCPACGHKFSIADLTGRRKVAFFRRLFGGSPSSG